MGEKPDLRVDSAPDATPSATEGDFRYDAFVSYRHVKVDRRWAKWLHRALETYRTPPQLIRDLHVLPRLRRVFRDEEELAASADLNAEIEDALQQSRFLIVVCSRSTPASKWVNREIERFREMGRHRRILALLIEGEPSEAFPPALCEIRQSLVEAQGVDGERLEKIEPLAADVRPTRTEGLWTRRRLARLRILACLLQCRFDDLRQREQERRRRNQIVLSVILATAFLAMAALTGVAFFEKRQADLARDAADKNASEAQTQKHLAENNAARAEANAREIRRRLAALYEEQGRQQLVLGDPGKAAAFLTEAYKENPGRTQLRFLVGTALLSLLGQQAVLDGRADSFTRVAWSPDGRWIATGDGAGTVTLWDATTGQRVTATDVSNQHVAGIVSLAFTPDSQCLAAADKGEDLVILKLSRPFPTVRLQHHYGPINDVAISADGKLLASAVYGPQLGHGTVRVWSVPDGKLRADLQPGLNTNSVAFSRDGTKLLSGNGDGTVCLWSWQTAQNLLERKSAASVLKARLSPDGSTIVSCDQDGHFNAWSALDGHPLASFTLDVPSPWPDLEIDSRGERLLVSASSRVDVIDLASMQIVRVLEEPYAYEVILGAKFSADGALVVTASRDGKARVWRTQDATECAVLAGHVGAVNAAVFSPSGESIVTVGNDGRGVIWDWKRLQVPAPLGIQERDVSGVSFGPVFSNLAVTATIKKLRVWDLSSGRLVCTIDHPEDEKAGGIFAEVVWSLSPDRTRAVTAGPDKSARIWQLSSGALVRALDHDGRVVAIAWSDDGRLIATGSWDRTVRLWDAKTGQLVHKLDGRFPYVESLAFSSGNKTILILDKEKGLILASVETGTTRAPPAGTGVGIRMAKPSRDGRYILAGSKDSKAQLLNAETGEQMATIGQIPFAGGIRIAEFSPDARVVAVVDGMSRVSFWETDSGKFLAQWTNSERLMPDAVAFRPQNDFVAVAVSSRIYIVDVHSGFEVNRISMPASVRSIAFAPNGNTMLVGTGSGVNDPSNTARLIRIAADVGTPEEALSEVNRLNTWILVDGIPTPRVQH